MTRNIRKRRWGLSFVKKKAEIRCQVYFPQLTYATSSYVGRTPCTIHMVRKTHPTQLPHNRHDSMHWRLAIARAKAGEVAFNGLPDGIVRSLYRFSASDAARSRLASNRGKKNPAVAGSLFFCRAITLLRGFSTLLLYYQFVTGFLSACPLNRRTAWKQKWLCIQNWYPR